MMQHARRIVPIAWDYERVYSEERLVRNKLHRVIPMPVDISSMPLVVPGSGQKLRVLHPVNRNPKGTAIILEAFKRLRSEYAHKADFVAEGNMPFEEFRQVLVKADIVVDQTTSYSYGMTAVFAMAMGKVVLSGLEDEVRESRYAFYRECPIINVRPSVEDVEFRLRQLLDNRSQLSELGSTARHFAETYHDCVKVARQYIEVYSALTPAAADRA
jgi:glycosyltransferase involved in cell wall biosynthesis